MTTTVETIKTNFGQIVTKIENKFNWLRTKVMSGVMSVTGSNATVTVTKHDGTTSTFTINNVANATQANQDSGGNVISTTYATKAELQAVTDGLVKVVPQLPTTNISTSTFYLVPNNSSEQNNIYNEYIAIYDETNDTYTWELVSRKQLDLSGYYTAEQVRDLLNEIFTSVTVTEFTDNQGA